MRDIFFDENQEFLIEILIKFDDISVNLVEFKKIRWKTNISDGDSNNLIYYRKLDGVENIVM